MAPNVGAPPFSAGRTPFAGELFAKTPVATPSSPLRTAGIAGQFTPLPQRLFPHCEVPPKIQVAIPVYQGISDSKNHALHNKSVAYSSTQVRAMGRTKKNVADYFGHKVEWNRTPPLRVFELLRRFTKICDESGISEVMAFYVLTEFSKGDLRTEIKSVMPSSSVEELVRLPPTWSQSIGC